MTTFEEKPRDGSTHHLHLPWPAIQQSRSYLSYPCGHLVHRLSYEWPKQDDGYNCSPNSLLFIYVWLVHRRFPSSLDCDVAGPNSDQEATRLFICYHLLTQGCLQLSPRWISDWVLGQDPIIPSQVLNQIRQSRTIVSPQAETRAIGAQSLWDPNPDYVVLDYEPRSKAAVPDGVFLMLSYCVWQRLVDNPKYSSP